MNGQFIILYRQNMPHRPQFMEPVIYEIDKVLGTQKLVIHPVLGQEVVKRKQSTLGPHIALLTDRYEMAVMVLNKVKDLNERIDTAEKDVIELLLKMK